MEASSAPAPVEQVVVCVPVVQAVVELEEVVIPPHICESVPSLRACRVDLAPLTVPASLSAGPSV